MAYYANVVFPSIDRVVDFQGSLGHGITPSTFRLTIVPQASSISTQGNLTITWTNLDTSTTQTLTFADCIVDAGSMEYDTQGALISLDILDRRWKWRFGLIAGRYNVRGADGNIIKADVPASTDAGEDSERTPQELATLLLDAMGETSYDVADLPADPRPKVEWDYENPAAALASLCDELGFKVVLQLDGTVALRQAGFGAALPSGPQMSISTEIDPPERPDKITVITGRSRFQADVKLKAVGLDTDGKIKPINDLSYKPAAGWVLGDITEFLDLATKEISEMAKRSVFRWYMLDVDSITLPVFSDALTRRWLVAEITDEQNTVGVEDGGSRPRQAWVFGVWYRELDDEAGNTGNGTTVRPITNFTDDQIVDRSWSYDAKRKMVKFGQAIYKQDASHHIIAPDLRIRLAFYASDPITRQWHRVTRVRDKTGDWGTNNTKEMVIHQDHLIPTYTASYVTNFLPANTTWTDNVAAIWALCDEYIDEEVARLDNRVSSAMTYAGLLIAGFELDGAITQVTWQVTTNGSSTKVYRNSEPESKTSISYDERKIFERQRLHRIQLNRQQKVGDIEPQKMVPFE